jgi:GntR family transcriptional regulator
MEIKLDFRIGIPIYVQIMEQIKQHIANSELKPGDQLPTVRQMATELRVNFNTIARAYRLLDEAGIISTQHGRGTYIAEEIPPAASAQLRRHALEELTHRYLVEAYYLEFSPQQVKDVFARYLEAWKSTGTPPGETLDHE